MSLIAPAGRVPADPVLTKPAPAALLAERVAGPRWDEIVADFDEACQEQLFAFARGRWPGVALEPMVFRRNDRIVGGALVMIQPMPLRLGAIAVVKWGPMLADARGEGAEALRAELVEALVEDYARGRGLMVSILPRAALETPNRAYQSLIARGFRPGATLLFPDRYIVNLRLSDAEQRKSFHQKWRYHLNRAEKAGLTFEHADPGELPAFERLYRAMSDRKKFADHSAYDTIDQLMAIPVPALRPELFFVRHEGEIVAGAIIFKAGDRAVYLYGATIDRALELRAGYLLHWKIIGWLRDHTEASWYDLGGTDGFQGLHQFKKGMVGDRGVITPVPPVANYAAGLLPRLVGEGAFAAREIVHRTGRFIDRLRADRARPDQKRERDGSR
ncbi:GNAT family N-acetyltransferase [Arsenicitalea aurantiaca]|uniref:GNAT family N-acetyltransferase n=1 Tax=Arsenicitalea aurantiaca TaxID=1783274 RepID=A0A433XGE8_9HYPH|nr:GNAT family N-acetyltransferase [Arsenicitalea aurantiaca]RUT33163.1 GNAT family N-acetyltransferase [Arsenicitalea aurantiaca]